MRVLHHVNQGQCSLYCQRIVCQLKAQDRLQCLLHHIVGHLFVAINHTDDVLKFKKNLIG